MASVDFNTFGKFDLYGFYAELLASTDISFAVVNPDNAIGAGQWYNCGDVPLNDYLDIQRTLAEFNNLRDAVRRIPLGRLNYIFMTGEVRLDVEYRTYINNVRFVPLHLGASYTQPRIIINSDWFFGAAAFIDMYVGHNRGTLGLSRRLDFMASTYFASTQAVAAAIRRVEVLPALYNFNSSSITSSFMIRMRPSAGFTTDYRIINCNVRTLSFVVMDAGHSGGTVNFDIRDSNIAGDISRNTFSAVIVNQNLVNNTFERFVGVSVGIAKKELLEDQIPPNVTYIGYVENTDSLVKYDKYLVTDDKAECLSNSSISLAVTEIRTNYTVLPTDNIVVVLSNRAKITIPEQVDAGKRYIIRKNNKKARVTINSKIPIQCRESFVLPEHVAVISIALNATETAWYITQTSPYLF